MVGIKLLAQWLVALHDHERLLYTWWPPRDDVRVSKWLSLQSTSILCLPLSRVCLPLSCVCTAQTTPLLCLPTPLLCLPTPLMCLHCPDYPSPVSALSRLPLPLWCGYTPYNNLRSCLGKFSDHLRHSADCANYQIGRDNLHVCLSVYYSTCIWFNL